MKTFIVIGLLLASTWAGAAVDLATCREDGRAIHPDLCKSLRQVEASNQRRAAGQAKDAAATQRAKERSDAFEAKQAEQRQAQAEQDEAERDAAATQEAVRLTQSKALKDSLAQSEREAERQQSAARKTCGDDFGKPRVGMALERAKTCLGYARLVGQVNRKDGVASVYTNDRVQLIVMADKVVAWTALR